MDPQQRVFLEICWECLERGGYIPDQCDVPVGVYGGMNNATYFQKHLSTRPDLVEAVGEFQVMLANEKDYITTRVANRLNLTGPAVSIHTACSTSLVAVNEAFHALRTGQCGMALAGGVAITCPPNSGYLYLEGAMLSPDGHTRSFDANAQGTVFSDGAAVVLLKRLFRCAGRRRSDLRGAARLGHQQRRRREGQLHRAQRERPGGRDLGGAGLVGRRRAQHLLRRDARHRDADGRPGRDRRPGQCLRAPHVRHRLLPHRLGQEQRRPPRDGGRCCGPDQDRAVAAVGMHSGVAAFRVAQSRDQLRRDAVPGERSPAALAARCKAAARGRELVRRGRHQRTCDRRRGAAARAIRRKRRAAIAGGVGPLGGGAHGGLPSAGRPSRCQP